jgi:ankyrin repeat protein
MMNCFQVLLSNSTCAATARAEVDSARTDTGSTALNAAACGGYERVVELLLAGGAAVDTARADSGSTALHAAAHAGHLPVLERLLAAGADVDVARTGDEGGTSLYLAAYGGYEHVVQWQGLALVHFSAQPKPFWSHLPVFPCLTDWGEIMHPTYPTKCAYVEPKIGRV